MKYRTKLDVIADILTATLQGKKKTRIMYAVNLSFTLINSYLKLLLASKLLNFDSSKRYYLISDKGKKFLSIFKDYKIHKHRLENRLEIIEEKKKQLNKMCMHIPN